MTVAERILKQWRIGNKEGAETMAQDEMVEWSNDWQNEKTTFTFHDGSAITFHGSLCYIVE